ncbi:hypothetical protein E0H46_28785 [Rhizobium leguminosarum bv. viciae]|nr:hypothetical protein E0H46_28785 [Rhizobium leguminosarum bv. viciae]
MDDHLYPRWKALALTLILSAISTSVVQAQTNPEDLITPPNPWLDEKDFVKKKIAEQQDHLIDASKATLKSTYKTVKVDIPSINLAWPPPLKIKGLKYLPKYGFAAVDWDVASFTVTPPSKIKPNVSVTISNAVQIGVVSMPPPPTEYVVYWNCEPVDAERKITHTDFERTEQTEGREVEQVRKETFEIKVSYSGGATSANAKLTSEVTSRFKSTIERIREDRQTFEQGYTIKHPKFSSVRAGQNLVGQIVTYEIEGLAVIDTPLYARLTGTGKSFKLQPWSSFAKARARSMPIKAVAEVDERVVHYELATNLKEYPSKEACDAARANAAVGGSLVLDSKAEQAGDGKIPVINTPSIVATPIAASEKFDSSQSTDIAKSPLLVPVTGEARAECKADVGILDGSLNGHLGAEFDVEVMDCPFDNFVSAGGITYAFQAKLKDGHSDTFRGFQTKWTNEVGPNFSIRDEQDFESQDLEEFIEITDAEATWCFCYSDK